MTYNPIASVELSGIEFVITASNDTCINLNIQIYVDGKLTKADGTVFDATDNTAVTNNFLHSLFDQCSNALNSVPITQVTEHYNYISFLDAIITYGSDAAI